MLFSRKNSTVLTQHSHRMQRSTKDQKHHHVIKNTKTPDREQGTGKLAIDQGGDDDDDTMIQVLIQPMNTKDRRTSRKFKDADPCYKFNRRDVANDTDLDFGDSDLSDSDQSGGYVDYDSLPNRWRRLSFEED
eukprot:scaffold13968_cov32-Cyclotella_meneghiniana.AAC.3